MSVNPEQFVAANQATVDALLAVANTALASAERIANLTLGTARAALEDGAAGAKALAGARNPQEAAQIQAALTQPILEKAVAYTQSVTEITQQAHDALAKTVEAQFADFQKTVATLLSQASRAAPAGSENTFAIVQSAVAAANSAFASMNASARQFAEAAQASVAAAGKATSAAAGKTRK